jgi:hypothetical protein
MFTYEFLSQGPNGTIKKVLYFQKVHYNFYNLAFGDWNEVERKIDDNIRTNNNDCQEVLAMVASRVTDFINYYPGVSIYAKGNTPGRTRLYQIGIFNNWDKINSHFYIEGYVDGDWEPIKKKRNYEAFIIMGRPQP